MKVSKEELVSVLTQFNPWWRSEPIPDLPTWRRAAFNELLKWAFAPPVSRSIMLSGARQVGKTTLIIQVIQELLDKNISPSNILYATFDHPILKLAGPDAVLEAWRTREPKKEGKEYIFLDEAQFIQEWGTWIKHQVDFHKNRHIIFTGSALPLNKEGQESGVGRWHTIKITTLSFFEYIQLKNLSLPLLPKIQSLKELFEWEPHKFLLTQEIAQNYIAHFYQYLLKGGFPQTALLDSVNYAQKLLREDIVDKVLKRDMTALFGVRRILELERIFLYICLHDGGILDIQEICKYLEVKRPTAQNFIDLLESTHLIYKLHPYGYGKEVLRGKVKVFISDASISPAVMLKGVHLLEDTTRLGAAVESCVLKHLFARYYHHNIKFSYWRQKENLEVDLIAELENEIIPFEVKYRSEIADTQLKGLIRFCKEKQVPRGYVVTKSINDFGVLHLNKQVETPILKIPAVLLCYWMGAMEIQT